MTDQNWDNLAKEFLVSWESYQRVGQRRNARFERSEDIKESLNIGLIASYTNPREGDYVIHHAYTGVAFFTGSGELVFTEAGLPLAKAICDRSRDMKVMKVVYKTHNKK